MTETVRTPPYTLGPEEKAVQVMAYTTSALYWGEVVVKDIIRVSTWLRTNAAPDRICLYNGRVLMAMAAKTAPVPFTELYISTSQINIFHMMPPAQDPPDYDPTEPNRKMQTVSLLVGNFRVDGHLRLPARTGLAKYLEVARESFASIYDGKISSPVIPSFGVVTAPFTLIRLEVSVFAQV